MTNNIPRFSSLVDAGISLSTRTTWNNPNAPASECLGNLEGPGFSTIDYAGGERPRYALINQEVLLGEIGRGIRTEIGEKLELFLVSLVGSEGVKGRDSLSAEVVEWLLSMRTIRGLCLNGFAAIDPFFSMPNRLEGLEELGFNSTVFSPTAVSALATLRNLKVLGISESSVPGSIGFLRSFQELQVLTLCPLEKPRDLLPTVARLSHLRYLGLSSGHLTDAEELELSSLLPNCQIEYLSSKDQQ